MKEDDRFDWENATRGKYAKKSAKVGASIRLLEDDVAKAFPDSASVNNALRMLIALRETAIGARKAKRRTTGKRAA
jgi:hypothetical protein